MKTVIQEKKYAWRKRSKNQDHSFPQCEALQFQSCASL